MKIIDVNKNKKTVSEAFADMFGDYGSAAVKKMLGQTGGKSLEQQMVQDMFLKDFVSRAISSLETAIKGNLVDPTITSQASPTPKPATSAQSQATAPKTPAQIRAQKQKAATQTAQQQMRPVAPATATTPKPAGTPTTESKYVKLNYVFEQIVNESESISQHLQKFFRQYMRGVDYSANARKVNELITAVQDTYSKDKGMAALNTLANTAFALSQSSAGGQSAVQPSTTPSKIPASSPELQNVSAMAQKMTNVQLVQFLKIGLTRLKKVDPALYAKVVKSISSGKKATTAAPAAPAATPPVTESKKS